MTRMIVFSDDSSYGDDGPVWVRDWDEFVALGCEPDGFWIDGAWPGQPAQLAAMLRASAWWDRLAFTALACDEPLLDGQAELEEAALRCARAQLAKESLGVPPALGPAEKLLLYLYVRCQHQVAPRYDRTQPGLYRYPLADALGAGAGDAWFEQLIRDGLLVPARLVDRIRACPACGSAHLSFVDVCPACASIDIRRTPTLRCFGCGHLAHRSDFDAGSHLACPRCEARVRHVGSDYAAPPMQYLCRQCRHPAPEPRVVATCFDCKHSHDPDRLEVREIHAYVLGRPAVAALRDGRLQEGGAQFQGRHLDFPQFRQMLLWSILAQRRHDGLSFSVLLFEAAQEDAGQAGPGQAGPGPASMAALLEDWAARLRDAVRASDASCVDGLGRLWVLLPFSAPEAAETRLLARTAQLRDESGAPLAVRRRSLFAPRDLLVGDGPDSIMARLLYA
jgi:hypothetical protein